jgi:hypothetical protein
VVLESMRLHHPENRCRPIAHETWVVLRVKLSGKLEIYARD